MSVFQPGGRLRTQYTRLAPDERFRAAIEAAARGDDDERESLVASCPQKTYRMADVQFLDRVEMSHDLAVVVALDLGPRIAQLRGLELTVQLLADLDAHLAELDADEHTGEDGVPDWPLLGELRQQASELRSQAAAVLEAFGALCRRDLGLEPEVVLHAHLGDLHVAGLHLEELEGAKHRAARRRSCRANSIGRLDPTGGSGSVEPFGAFPRSTTRSTSRTDPMARCAQRDG